MDLAAAQFGELFHCFLGVGVGVCAYRERDESLIGVYSRIVVAEVLHLEVLYRLDNIRRHEEDVIVDLAKVFERVEDKRRGRSEQI